jgi:hypothetical protein
MPAPRLRLTALLHLALLALCLGCVSHGDAPPVPPGPAREELPPLAFIGSRLSGQFSLYVLAPDAQGAPRELFPLQAGADVFAPPRLSLSADGRTLAVVRFLSPGGSALELVDVATGEARTLSLRSLSPSAPPVWSPDGARLVLRATASGELDGELFGVDVASGELLQLTDDERSEQAPVFSPDGREVRFIGGDIPLGTASLFAVPADASAGPAPLPGALSLAGMRATQDVALAPQATAVAYVTPDDAQGLLCVRTATGEHCPLREQRVGMDGSPAFSADGRFVAFTSTVGEWDHPELYVMAVERAGATRLTALPGPDLQPQFLPSLPVP